MSKKSTTFAAEFGSRMDLTACNLVKTMLKERQKAAAWLRFLLNR